MTSRTATVQGATKILSDPNSPQLPGFLKQLSQDALTDLTKRSELGKLGQKGYNLLTQMGSMYVQIDTTCDFDTLQDEILGPIADIMTAIHEQDSKKALKYITSYGIKDKTGTPPVAGIVSYYTTLEEMYNELAKDPILRDSLFVNEEKIKIDHNSNFTPRNIIFVELLSKMPSDPDLSPCTGLPERTNRYKDLAFPSTRNVKQDSYFAIYSSVPPNTCFTDSTRLTTYRRTNFIQRIESDGCRWAMLIDFTPAKDLKLSERLYRCHKYESHYVL